MRPREFLGRSPATVAVAATTVIISIPALVRPGLVRLLEQRPAELWHGQWWRAVTPMLIQGYGLGQFVFNLAGIVLVGVAVERRTGPGRWLGIYFVSGITDIMVTSWLFPGRVDSGSSAAVAGLIGALTLDLFRSRRVPWWPSLLYALFFSAYLTALAFGGPIVASVIGTFTIPVVVVVRLWALASTLRVVALGVIGITGCLLLSIGDPHGIGLTTGVLMALVVGTRRQRAVDTPRGAGSQTAPLIGTARRPPR